MFTLVAILGVVAIARVNAACSDHMTCGACIADTACGYCDSGAFGICSDTANGVLDAVCSTGTKIMGGGTCPKRCSEPIAAGKCKFSEPRVTFKGAAGEDACKTVNTPPPPGTTGAATGTPPPCDDCCKALASASAECKKFMGYTACSLSCQPCTEDGPAAVYKFCKPACDAGKTACDSVIQACANAAASPLAFLTSLCADGETDCIKMADLVEYDAPTAAAAPAPAPAPAGTTAAGSPATEAPKVEGDCATADTCTKCAGFSNCQWCTKLPNSREVKEGQCAPMGDGECGKISGFTGDSVTDKGNCLYDRNNECEKYEEGDDAVMNCEKCNDATEGCQFCSTAAKVGGFFGIDTLKGGSCSYKGKDGKLGCLTGVSPVTKDECKGGSAAGVISLAIGAVLAAAVAAF